MKRWNSIASGCSKSSRLFDRIWLRHPPPRTETGAWASILMSLANCNYFTYLEKQTKWRWENAATNVLMLTFNCSASPSFIPLLWLSRTPFCNCPLCCAHLFRGIRRSSPAVHRTLMLLLVMLTHSAGMQQHSLLSGILKCCLKPKFCSLWSGFFLINPIMHCKCYAHEEKSWRPLDISALWQLLCFIPQTLSYDWPVGSWQTILCWTVTTVTRPNPSAGHYSWGFGSSGNPTREVI